MKKLFSIILSVVILSLSICLNTIQTNAVTYTGTITLNTNVVKSLNSGDTAIYYFTAPSSGLYAVETTGSTDTYATVVAYDENNVFQTYTDDDSGVDNNFNIGFYQKQNTVAVITVNHHGSSSGMFTIHVHRQKANIFTYNYTSSNSNLPALNTYSHAYTPVTVCGYAGYLATNFTDKEHNFFKSYIVPNNESNINAEIFMFSGHGNKGYACPLSGQSISYEHLQLINGFKMRNTKIALWNTCYSASYPTGAALPDPDAGYLIGSLAQASYWSGARSVIGWTDEIFSNDVRKWTNDFFQKLEAGQTVFNAALHAGLYAFLPDNPCASKWSLLGSTSTVLAQPQVNIKGNTLENEELNMDEFLDNLKNNDYREYKFDNGVTRYYRTVNNILTNDYYDVYNDIVLKSDDTLSDSDLEQIDTLCPSINNEYKAGCSDYIVINGELYNNKVSENEIIMIMKKDNNIKIVDFLTAIYENENGFREKQVNCSDLITGEILNYEQMIE